MDVGTAGDPIAASRMAAWSGVLGRVVLALALVAAAVGGGGWSPVPGHRASAASQVSWGGSPGPYAVGRITTEVRWNVEDERYYVSLMVPGPTVGRSPALAGAQPVLVATELLTYGTWTGWWVIDSRLNHVLVWDDPLTSWPASFDGLQPGYYLVRHTIVWAANHVQVDYDHPTDYDCIGGSPARPLCTAYDGYIQVHPI